MSFALTILGSNSALPTSQRFSTAQILNVSERFFLIDCGEGCQIQCRKYKVRFGKLNHILISHLHGDHYFGLWGMLSTFNLLNRRHPLHIYAHNDLKHLIDLQMKYFGDHFNYEIIFTPLKFRGKNLLFEDEALTIESFPLKHRVPCCGFLFREKQKDRNIKPDLIKYYDIPVKKIAQIKKGADFINATGQVIPNKHLTIDPPKPLSYAFCTDTRYHEKIIPYINGVDVLYHEATYLDDLKKQAFETYHCTTKDAARIALKARVEKLIIGHYSARYNDLNPLLDEARSVFPETFLAEDGKIFRLK